MPEDDDSAKLRLIFFRQLVKSCPYHASIIQIVVPGDCAGLIAKVTKSMMVTNRAKSGTRRIVYHMAIFGGKNRAGQVRLLGADPDRAAAIAIAVRSPGSALGPWYALGCGVSGVPV